MSVVVVSPPVAAVSLADAKRHLRVDWSDDDDIISSFVAAAQGHIDGPDGWLGRAVGLQELEYSGWFGCDRIALPYPPIVDIVAVETAPDHGQWIAVDPSEYRHENGELIVPPGARWVTEARHRIRYKAGYDTVPPAIQSAILLMTADLYLNRESVSATKLAEIPMPTTAERLLAPLRRWV